MQLPGGRYELFEGDCIGRGGFASVYRGFDHVEQKTVAIKQIDHAKVRQKGLKKIYTEFQIHKEINHESIVKLYDKLEDKSRGETYLIMEYCRFGDLDTFLKKHGALSEDAAAYVLQQVVDALRELHGVRQVMHRDLSTCNIFIADHVGRDKLNVKIGDFGLSAQLRYETERKGTVLGTPQFMSPQVALGQSYGTATDIYSLGIVLYAMLAGGRKPFDVDTRKNLIGGKISGRLKEDAHLLGFDADARDLILKMTTGSENGRITLSDISSHPFMSKYGRRIIRSATNRRADSGRGGSADHDSGYTGSNQRYSGNPRRDQFAIKSADTYRRRAMGVGAHEYIAPLPSGRLTTLNRDRSTPRLGGASAPVVVAHSRPSCSAERLPPPVCGHSRVDDDRRCYGCGVRMSLVGQPSLPPPVCSRVYDRFPQPNCSAVTPSHCQHSGHAAFTSRRCPSLAATGRCGGTCTAEHAASPCRNAIGGFNDGFGASPPCDSFRAHGCCNGACRRPPEPDRDTRPTSGGSSVSSRGDNNPLPPPPPKERRSRSRAVKTTTKRKTNAKPLIPICTDWLKPTHYESSGSTRYVARLVDELADDDDSSVNSSKLRAGVVYLEVETKSGWRIMRIQSNSTSVSVYKSTVLSTSVEQCRYRNADPATMRHILLEDMNDWERQYYMLASAFIELLKQNTPKIVVYASNWKATLFHGLNCVVKFANGKVSEMRNNSDEIVTNLQKQTAALNSSEEETFREAYKFCASVRNAYEVLSDTPKGVMKYPIIIGSPSHSSQLAGNDTTPSVRTTMSPAVETSVKSVQKTALVGKENQAPPVSLLKTESSVKKQPSDDPQIQYKSEGKLRKLELNCGEMLTVDQANKQVIHTNASGVTKTYSISDPSLEKDKRVCLLLNKLHEYKKRQPSPSVVARGSTRSNVFR